MIKYRNEVLSSENKLVRQRISDFYKLSHLQPILIKFWQAILPIQYEEDFIKTIVDITSLQISLTVYDTIIEVFIKALGPYFSDTYYVAKMFEYKKKSVPFERFTYDLISLFGINLLYIECQDMELILRKLF